MVTAVQEAFWGIWLWAVEAPVHIADIWWDGWSVQARLLQHACARRLQFLVKRSVVLL